MIQGSIVAIATPMFPDGSIDYERLKSLVEFHVVSGTNAIVAVGTTGESPTVSMEENVAIIGAVIEYARGRVPVIAGTGANSTKEAIELSHQAKSIGAKHSLSVVPYYNKPSQEGMYQHFKAIVEAVDLPQILYNVPGRTVADLHNDTTLRLAQIPGVIGIKDATGNLERAADLVRRAPKGFALYSGDDGSALAFMMMGGHGVISVTANVAPALMATMCRAALQGDFVAARAANDRLQALHRDLFVEGNPIPVKWVLEQMGRIGPGMRLPLTPLSATFHNRLREAMRAAGID
jgi:4-hydroxy-tetrahydrodipicolinate synthase